LTARDLNGERALEAEHDVEEVERLGAELVDQRRVDAHVLRVAAERLRHDPAHDLLRRGAHSNHLTTLSIPLRGVASACATGRPSAIAPTIRHGAAISSSASISAR